MDHTQLRAGFLQAINLPEGARKSFVAQYCSGDLALQTKLEELLTRDADGISFLESPLVEQPWMRRRMPGLVAGAGRRCGPYELLHEIGRGGMSVVYLGVRADESFHLRVAVKIIDRAHSGEDIDLRIRQERQVLADLDHPNIARLYDGGITDDGLAFLVMEYIEDGKPIDVYCRDRGLSIPDRLRLFLGVCEAVSYAHRRLVVHRDLKPTNILVTLAGVPKLIDFGIAKLLQTQGATDLTTDGSLRLTPQYASPEQFRGIPVTTASDVYSLGVVLFELLTGQRPYPPTARTAAELASFVLKGETIRPSSLESSLAGDVEAILLTALCKDPLHRYGSVERLQDDITRFLQGQPVLARGDSAYYRSIKFVTKHWLAVSIAASAVVILSALAIISIMSARRAREQYARVEKVLTKAFSEAKTRGPEAWWYGLRSYWALETARLAYLEPLSQEYLTDLSFQVQRFQSWREIGNLNGLPSLLNLGNTAEAKRSLEKAVDIGEELLRRWGSDPARRKEVALAQIELGSVMIEMDLQSDAEQHFIRADDLANLESGSADERVALEALAQKSRLLVFRGRRLEALALRRQIVDGRRRLFEKNPDGVRREYAGALCSYGKLLREIGRFEEAYAAYTQGLPLLEELARNAPYDLHHQWDLGRQHAEYAKVLVTLGKHRAGSEHLDRAIMLYRYIKGREPAAMSNQRTLAVCLRLRGEAMLRTGETQRAMSLFDEALGLSDEAARHDPGSSRAQAELASIRAAVASISSTPARTD